MIYRRPKVSSFFLTWQEGKGAKENVCQFYLKPRRVHLPRACMSRPLDFNEPTLRQVRPPFGRQKVVCMQRRDVVVVALIALRAMAKLPFLWF